MQYQRELGFEVWVEQKTLDGKDYSQCMAAFYYWQECLDYKDYAFKAGTERLVIRSYMPAYQGQWRSEVRTKE